MSKRTTLEALTRREVALVSCLTVAASFVALGQGLGIHWMSWLGLTIAILGGTGRLAITLRRLRLEGAREQTELDRRTLVAALPIAAIDPTDLGVDAAAQAIIPGGEIPDYLVRNVDDDLRQALVSALEGEGRWIVILVGSSKVGKSRAMYEALRACPLAADLSVWAPADGKSLESLLLEDEGKSNQAVGRVLWLDDLEPFINDGLTMQTLREWRAGRSGRSVVVATYGGKGAAKIQGSEAESLVSVANEIFQHAVEIPLTVTSPKELDPLRSQLAETELEMVERHGLAAYLVAAPAIHRKLATHRHALGEPDCPEGIAIVRAAVDWQRCGRTDPLPKEVLQGELWANYLPPGCVPSVDGFEIGVEWALRRVAGSIALIEDIDGYLAYDYVVEVVVAETPTSIPHDSAWASAIATATGAQALAVGENASLKGHLSGAAEAFEIAARTTQGVAQAIAYFNLGATFGELERSADAVRAYEKVVARFRDSEELGVLEVVTKAEFNRGVRLGMVGREREALAAYDEIVTRYEGTEELLLRAAVAKALFKKAVTLSRLGHIEDAIHTYEEIERRLGGAPEPILQTRIAKTMVNRGGRLQALGQNDEALVVYSEVVARFDDSGEGPLGDEVVRALTNKGLLLAKLNRFGELAEVYEEMTELFADKSRMTLWEMIKKLPQFEAGSNRRPS